ncbi:Berberine and berberine like [Promicromonospora umidemergens]|uniref:FAD-binding protein n=1 Tax=Promicromonospora umidemergens TaxID=629679 RepID=A0ABP8X359_9MICO|nr:FAD-binding protein [Promicromonospora umidemergens]MCP2281118.1 Berberine and berberine like [Promicromonospora umidemergens]
MSNSPASTGSRPIVLSDRQGFDRRWFASKLEAVYVPKNDTEAVSQITDAISRHGRDVKVVSGRHCYENFVYNGSTRAIIDMSSMNRVGWDKERSAFFVEAGCENWSVYRALLNGFNKTLPGGTCYSVGAGGHITGGGYGLLSRLHGLVVDHLSAVDIVTWNDSSKKAELHHVSATSTKDEQELFWALRGAGCGNFGVILRYYFNELPEAPELASIYTLSWDWSSVDTASFADLLAYYAEFVGDMPETEFSLLKLTHVSAGQLGMTVQAVSPAGTTLLDHRAETERRYREARTRFGAIVDHTPLRNPLGGHPGWMTDLIGNEKVQHVTYLEALQTMNGSGPNQFGKYKSAYMNKAFPSDQVDKIYRWLNTTPEGVSTSDMSQSLLQVDSYGGAINRVASDVTAVPQRSAIMKLQYQTYWLNDARPGEGSHAPYDAQTEAHLGWINEFYRDVYAEYGGTPNPAKDPSGTVAGAYYNYPDSVLGTHAKGTVDDALRLYFLDNFRKNERNLVAVKRRWDSADIFHHGQSIPVE